MRSVTFRNFLQMIRASGSMAVQPRMGWGSPLKMRRALQRIKEQSCQCVGTITLDSYTRVGDYQTPLECLRRGVQINGYPLVSHSAETTRGMLQGVVDETFPVQVRHGTPEPQSIFRRTLEVGLDASEGGPVSYCLPYGRTPLLVATRAWGEACRIFADGTQEGHIESFGGCLMGQLCPPSMLVAITLLECLFFRQFGIRSVSLSYAQGPSHIQDRAALAVLRRLAGLYLGDIDWHVVVYTYMGVFPDTQTGATRLIEDSAVLARESGCERLIVKTVAERRQIPTLEDNLAALRAAVEISRVHRSKPMSGQESALYAELLEETQSLLNTVLNLSYDIAEALLAAFKRGLLDVPYCVHPDNCGKTQAAIDEHGILCWTRHGNLPIRGSRHDLGRRITSDALLAQLSYVACSYDRMQHGGDERA